MGASASITITSISNLSRNSQGNQSSTGASEDEATLIHVPQISPTGLAADIILPGPIYRKINKPLVEKCKQSWLRIASTSNSLEGNAEGVERGFAAFCGVFFFYMEELDVDNVVLIKFQPRPSSFCVDRDALLLRVVNFVLSIPSDNFKVKSKIRALGRAHARVGIVEKHFEMFTKALLKSIANRLGPLCTTETIGAWLDLMSFATHQLTFDKINFKPHHNTGLDEEDEDPRKEMDLSAESMKKYESMISESPIIKARKVDSQAPTPTSVEDTASPTELARVGVERTNTGETVNGVGFESGDEMVVSDRKEVTPQMARMVLEGNTEPENCGPI
jgi:hypothetical protein